MRLIFGLLLWMMFAVVANAQTLEVKAPLTNIQVKSWINLAILSVFDYNYQNMIAQQKQAARYFSHQGWKNFLSAYQQAGIAEVVKKNQYAVTAAATQPATINQQGLQSGQYHWQIKMPLVVVYKNNKTRQCQYLNVTLDIIYQGNPRLGSTQDLKIERYIAIKGQAPSCQSL